MSLVFLVEPKEGLSRRLLSQTADMEHEPLKSQFRLAFLTGPHGLHCLMGNYGNILLFASGFGIAAQPPYVKELICDYHRCKVRTRHVHLVWQIQNFGVSLLLLE